MISPRAIEVGARTEADMPVALQQCIDEFWESNAALKREILRDFYNLGRVSYSTELHGCEAVNRWLRKDDAAVNAAQPATKDTSNANQ